MGKARQGQEENRDINKWVKAACYCSSIYITPFVNQWLITDTCISYPIYQHVINMYLVSMDFMRARLLFKPQIKAIMLVDYGAVCGHSNMAITLALQSFQQYYTHWVVCVNIMRPGQDDPHFSYDIFKWISYNENCCILILNYVPRDPIDNHPALVQIMARCRTGNRPLSEPMMGWFGLYAFIGFSVLKGYQVI